jgi:lipid-A-disaccharide synthase
MTGSATRPANGGAFGLVAGEASGDNLGRALIEALAVRDREARFYGVAGPGMAQAGCASWYSADALAVMGLAEVLTHLPRLLRLRRDLLARFETERPDVFIGIDSPEFNLRLASGLKARGVPTVQYVSPQVWAWRQGRVRTIGRAVDLVLCLLPFEVDFYAAHDVRAVFVGHPLADAIPFESSATAARARLGLPEAGRLVSVLPGSRIGEVAKLGPPFAATLAWLAARQPDLQFVAPMASARTREAFAASLATHAPQVPVRLVDGQAQECMSASDAVLLASGTVTLEAALVKRPMVVAYRVAPLTAWLVRDLKLVKTEYFAHPNLLAGRRLVPEYFQEAVRPEVLGPAVLEQLARPDHEALLTAFGEIHRILRRDASARAAEAILDLVARRRKLA